MVLFRIIMYIYAMKTYSAIIIDDERHVREVLARLLHEYCPEIHVAGEASSASEGRKLLSGLHVDVIFLDISMPHEDGFSFLRSIEKEKYAVIFVTAYQEHALRAMKANAIDYLLKPVNPHELQEAVSKAVKYHEIRHHKESQLEIYKDSLSNLDNQLRSGSSFTTKITISEQYGFRIVHVDQIMYLQADSNYTILHLSGLEKIVATRSLCEFEKILDPRNFFRVHKSTIINLHFLKRYSSYQGNFIELTDGTCLSLSRRKLNEFREVVGRFSKSLE